ncbi:MAG: hypothetical protein RRX92_05785 [Lachnospiraceae bacterium]
MDATMQIFADKIKETIETIDLLTEAIAKNRAYAAERLMPVFINLLQAVIPIIISSYELPQLQDEAEDMTYWQGQMERIMEALEREDWFAMIDVLHYETKENLMLYLDRMEKMEIVL